MNTSTLRGHKLSLPDQFATTAKAGYTGIEPWLGGYNDTSITASRRSNYGLREEVVALRRKYPNGSTVIPTHGANPGLISHWVKQGLINLSRDILKRADLPVACAGSVVLAYSLKMFDPAWLLFWKGNKH